MNREIKFRVWDNVDYMAHFTFSDIIERNIAFTDECPIMQYTGLKDKDGKEIYEGDILDYEGNHKSRNSPHKYYVVDFLQGCFVAKGYNGSISVSPNLNHRRDYIIVGNIFESPELLNQDHE